MQMGVKDFARLKENYSPIRVSHFDKVIIDASNLFYTVLSRHLGKLKTFFNTYAFGGIKKNIMDQCAYILYHSAYDISVYLQNLKEKYTPKSIFLVLDPLQTPSYYINTAKENTNFQWLTEIFSDIVKGSTIETKLKYMEQEKRKGKDLTVSIISTLKNRFSTLESLKEYKEDPMMYAAIEDLCIRYAKSTLMLSQSTNIMKLSESLILMLGMFSFDKSVVKIVRAISEADLLIKNLAKENVPTLIVSRDSDYFFLVSEFKHCYCAELLINSSIYHPWSIFSDFLEGAFNKDYIIRLSALVGNDYTLHKGILSFRNLSDIRSFFNLNGNFNTLREGSKRKNACKLASKMPKLDVKNPTPINNIDVAIHDAMPDYFTSYYQFVLIYTHYEYYSRYTELEIENKIEFPKDIQEVIIQCDEEFQNENWDSFLDNVKVVRNRDQLNKLLSTAISTLQEIGDEEEYFDDQNDDYSDGMSDLES